MDTTANRRRFIDALRINPLGLVQHHDSTMYNRENGTVCALGVGCFEFGVDLSMYMTPEGADSDPYGELKYLLMMDDTLMALVWSWNDSRLLSFRQIADKLEEQWFPVVIQAEDLTENK